MSPLTEPTRLTLAKDFTWNETVWNPSMISTALWLDAADASTISESSGAVSQWNDKSGNGRNFTSTGSARPTKGTNYIDFDGVNDRLSATLSLNQPLTVYLTMQMLARPASGQKYVFGVGDSFDFVSNSSSQVRILAPSNLAATDSTQTTDSIYSLLYNSNSSAIYKNGSLLTSGNAGSGALSGAVMLGDYSVAPGSIYATNVRCYELVIAPSSSVNQKIEGYLAHKWGLTANLPAGHPYKTVGPTP